MTSLHAEYITRLEIPARFTWTSGGCRERGEPRRAEHFGSFARAISFLLFFTRDGAFVNLTRSRVKRRRERNARVRTRQVPHQAPRARLGSVRAGGRRPGGWRPVQKGKVRRRRRRRGGWRERGVRHRRARRVRRGRASQLRDPRRVRARSAPGHAAEDVRREGCRREGGRRTGRRRRRSGRGGRRVASRLVQTEARDSRGRRASDGPVPELSARRGASSGDAVPGAALDDASRCVRRVHGRSGASNHGATPRVSSSRRPVGAGLHEASQQPLEASRRFHADRGAVPVPGDVLFRRPRG